MKIPRLLFVVIAAAAIAGIGATQTATPPATPTVTPGEPVVVAVHRFPAGDHVWGMLSPGSIPVGPATVSSQASVTVFVPVWAVPGHDHVMLIDARGRREEVPVAVGARVLPWPITLRIQGLR